MIGGQEIIVIAIIVLLLFGGKKIPELMHGLGRGVKSFKEGMSGIENEIKKEIPSEDLNRNEQQPQQQSNVLGTH
jgi:sec-independent protein translocase protein TatA